MALNFYNFCINIKNLLEEMSVKHALGGKVPMFRYLKKMSLSNWSIRNQILLIVAIVGIPAIGIMISTILHQRSDAIHEARVETQELVHTIVNDQKNLIAATRQLSVVIAQLPQIKEHNQYQLEFILRDILKVSPQYSNIFLVDPSGAVWASGIPITREVKVNNTRFFKNAVRTGNFSSGEYNIPFYSEKPTLCFGYPVQNDDGSLFAIVAVGLSFDYYRNIFKAYDLIEGTSFAFFDHRGVVLARAVEPEKYIGTAIDPEIYQRMLEGPKEETNIVKSSIIGDKRVQTYSKFKLSDEPKHYLYLRVGVPLKPLIVQSLASYIPYLIIYSLALVLGLFVSWIIGKKHIIDRLNCLQQASYNLANGDTGNRIKKEFGGGELGQLGRAFNEMAQQLSLREKSLRESEKLKEEMFSNLSHEMRTPLTGMLGFLEYVTKNEVDPKQLQEYLNIMHKEGERLNDLVSNFLDMQRLKSKIETLELQPIQVREISRDVVELFSNPSTKHLITNKVSGALPPIAGDSSLIHQALNNLVSNAIKYSPESSEIVVDAKLNGDMVSFYVKDQGIGIPAEFHDRIFDAFYRVEEKGKSYIKGTGLGLALVKRITEAHNGQVSIDSAKGLGTTFILSVPVYSGKSTKIS